MDYRSIIESKYNRKKWQALLYDIFKKGTNFLATPIPVNAKSDLAVSSVQLGTITLTDGNKIAVYEITLSETVDILVNRVGIRNLLAYDWKMKGCVGAFMFCFRNNESVLRFSYVSQTMGFDEDGKLIKKETDTKRYTYYLGEGHRSRTAIRQFEELRNSKLSLADISKAFSIEALSDKFFKDYKSIYEDIVEYATGKRMIKVSNKWEERVIKAPNASIMNGFRCFPNPEKAVRDYVKNLMGRIVFLQFIQKKGWLGVPVGKEWGEGDKEFLQNLYDNCNQKDNFIDGILEVLFNDINTKRTDDVANTVLGSDIKMPYLNGGLFELSKADECSFRLPKKLMDAIITFFSSYNFTIDENDPNDAEIGIDPEMLGRIFENLLEDNKDKGAFYTPKEIVQYMCKESLIAYLQTDKLDVEKEAIRQFVTTYNANVLSSSLSVDVDKKLKDVKICDPAIGSGAFPMGLLKELFACRSALEDLSGENAADIKKQIIQNNIYGVDIEKGAVDIARLRFWLSIIVDELTPHSLPNMDFKIMQGNSLIPTFNGKYVNLNDKLRHINSSKICEAKKELFRLQSVFYDAEGDLKKELLVKIKYQILEIVKLQMDFEYKAEVERSSRTMNLFKPNIRQTEIDDEKNRIIGICIRLQNDLNSSKPLAERAEIQIPFFDWKIMFSDVFISAINDGFDIVIGNPPFISSKTQMANPSLAEQRRMITESKKYNTIVQKWDIYVPFMELAMRYLSRKDGVITMIVPYPLTNQVYAKKLRKFIIQQFDLFEIVDLSGIKVFSATVTNCIPFIRCCHSVDEVIVSNGTQELTVNKIFRQPIAKLVPDTRSYIWNLTEKERLIDEYSNLPVLGDLCYISKGMVLHSEEGLFSNEDLVSDFQDDVHCRAYIEAKDMDIYAIKRIRYIEYDTWRVPDAVSRPTFRELYSNQKLLFNCLGQMKVSIDLNDKLICQHSVRVAVLWKDLRGVDNKSITSSIKRYSSRSREEMEMLSEDYTLLYLLGVLNSEYVSKLYADIRGGDYHVVPEHIRQIPIPKASVSEQESISKLALAAMNRKRENPNADISDIETTINGLVENLYNRKI